MFNHLTVTEESMLWLVALGIVICFVDPVIGLSLLALALLLAWGSVLTIPAQPPCVAVPAVWGRRTRRIVRERITFACSFFPVFEELIIISVERQERTLKVRDVRCKPMMDSSDQASNGKQRGTGGAVEIDIGIIFQPDSREEGNLIDYLNAGGRGWPPLMQDSHKCFVIDRAAEEKKQYDSVWRQLEMLLAGAVRQMGDQLTWSELANSKAEVSAKVIGKLTGQQPTVRVQRTENGNPAPDMDRHSKFEFLLEPIPQDYKLTELDYEMFLKMLEIEGMKDVQGLGIVIRRLSIERVEPQGLLKREAEKLDIEAAQRAAETADFNTEDALAKRYMEQAKEAGTPMTYAEALERVRINRGRAQETIVRSSGNNLLDAAALFQNKNNKGPSEKKKDDESDDKEDGDETPPKA